ncbi:hypothetical protein ASD93_10875 [Microbacterium sp. Root180]|nr:hypothetical protein ASD93_10875 [Microbacterium sp. Root180]
MGSGIRRGRRVADIDGTWALEVATLAGSRRFDLTVTTEGTTLTGTAVGSTGPVPLRHGTAVGDTAEFVLDLAAPLPMSLVFELRVIGDRVTGTAQSGPFPPSSVLGTRTG